MEEVKGQGGFELVLMCSEEMLHLLFEVDVLGDILFVYVVWQRTAGYEADQMYQALCRVQVHFFACAMQAVNSSVKTYYHPGLCRLYDAKSRR